MDDYISRQATIEAFDNADKDVMADYGENYGCEWGFSSETVNQTINNIPSVNVRPVIYGKWIKGHWHNSVSCANCSVCNFEAHHNEFRGVQKYYKLCPNCGAIMMEE